jgi:murein DD-endopeptidase MepM/ murein hydrolase activator NlpD
MQELAEANHLSPPYRILAGGVLVIPPAGAAPPASAGPPAASVAVAALPPRAVLPPPQAAKPPGTTPQPTTHPAAPLPPVAPAEGQSQSHLAASRPEPRPAPAPQEPAGAQPVAQPTASAAHGGGSFAWPVRGHILEGFGAGPEGTHNDGINIAAPRGAPVEAADAGVVAYAGNELRGYGNLLLIKHPGGWITAYAHCDAILVKPGQKVTRGQVIARVGASGNVSTPQLHFELRRGNKPVDPRGYLSAAPSAPARPG